MADSKPETTITGWQVPGMDRHISNAAGFIMVVSTQTPPLVLSINTFKKKRQKTNIPDSQLM